VVFDMDANGILNVSAAEKSSGKSQKITITNEKGRLSKEDIERMVEEAEKAAEQDKEAMERVTAKNDLESYLYNARNSLRDNKDKLDAESVEKGEAALKEHIEWLDTHPGETRDDYMNRRVTAEEVIRPILGKLQGAPEEPPVAPKIEEVD
jgi:heat shock protein 1/8